MTPAHGSDTTVPRPRVEGVREQEILDAAIDVLSDVGYDRLTMDSVASRAKASKATLYRRWSSKAQLVIDALLSRKDTPVAPDTGSLRGDLMATFCGHGGLTDHQQVATFASVLTALMRDQEFAEVFRRDFIGPKQAVSRSVFERAHERGEVAAGVDLDLLATALPGVVLQRMFLMGEQPTPDLIASVIDQIILPAATCGAPTSVTTPEQHPEHQQEEKDIP